MRRPNTVPDELRWRTLNWEYHLTGEGLEGQNQRLKLVGELVARRHYDRPDIIKATADAVTRSKALLMILDRYDLFAHGNGGGEPNSKQAKFDEIRRRIDEGFYDDPNHLAALAEKFIKKLGLD
jgi:hypothetical protein